MGLGFRVHGFRFWGLGFMVEGSRRDLRTGLLASSLSYVCIQGGPQL